MQVTQSFLDRLESRKAQLLAEAQSYVQSLGKGSDKMTTAQVRRFNHFTYSIQDVNAQIDEVRSELERKGTWPGKDGGQFGKRGLGSAGRLAPLAFDHDELRALHGKLQNQTPGRIEARAFGSASSLLPAELYPTPTFPIHDNRILDYLPGFELDAPSLEVIQVNSVTGAAAIVAEGSAKPEVTPVTTRIIVASQKIAAHMGLSWESIQDWDSFSSFARTELMRQVVDVENREICYGDGTTGHLTGLLGVSGILTHAVTGTPVTHFDDLEQAIAILRTGPALAEPDLFVTHPATWSAIRREKNSQGSYYAQPDPTSSEPASVWGVPVLVSTQITAGDGIFIDTTKFGRVAVHEPMNLRIGFNGNDFVQNIVRTVCEERLALVVERAAAILHVTNLPTS